MKTSIETNNYPSWLVPIELAKKLKEIGFNEACPFIVYPNDDEVVISGVTNLEVDDIDEDGNGEICVDLVVTQCYAFNKYNFQTIPTWEQVFEWFREKGCESYIKLESHSRFDEGSYYYFEITDSNLCQLDCQGGFDDYKEAREKLVYKLIEIYKQNE